MSVLRVAVWSVVVLACCVGGFFYGAWLRPDGSAATDRPAKIHFVAAAPDDFHQVAIAGARKAADELGADVEFLVPASSEEQSSMIIGMNGDDVDGVAISPLSPRNQTRILSRLATKVAVITYDNDAPTSLRHCYIGTDNYSGGQLSAKAVKDLLPDGGELAIFIGDTERDNARLRRLGFIDELLGRQRGDESRVDPIDLPLEGGGYTIVGTFLDDHDVGRCAENVERAVRENENLDALVGLYGYVAPACLSVLEKLENPERIRIVGFDEHEATLRGIEEGKVAATIVQDPFEYGYQSVRMLSAWREDRFVEPPMGNIAPVLIPCQRVGPENLEAYRSRLKAHLAVETEG